MSSAAEILVIIVSIVLSLFLLVSIILGIYLVRLSAEIKRIAKTAERAVDSIGDAVQGVANFASPGIAAYTIGQFVKRFTKKSRKK
jgi:K+-transporting ATPase A subunit